MKRNVFYRVAPAPDALLRLIQCELDADSKVTLVSVVEEPASKHGAHLYRAWFVREK